MDEQNKTKPIVPNILWAFAERFLAQLVTLCVSVILARLLSPEDYSIVAIVTIFITIANVFVTSGYGSALIQKQNADELDFSSTLIFSLLFSVLLYVILFLAAPFIADFYHIPLLIPVVRVLSLRIIFAAINTIQQAYVSKQMAFKKFFLSTSIGTIVSAVVGIVMAYNGFGVWALVAQYLTNTMVDTVVLSVVSRWRFKFCFSASRLKGLIPYGSKLLISDLFSNFYTQLRGLLMSRFYAPVDLSYYNQSEKYTSIFINNIGVSINKVMFQIASNTQDDLKQLKELTRKTVRLAFFILCPIQIGLAASAETWIPLLLTEKWLPCVPHLQILCFAYLMDPIIESHTRNMKALKQGNRLLAIMILRYSVGILLLVLTLFYTRHAVVLTATLIPIKLFAVIVCGAEDRKLVGYSFYEQLSDLAKSFFVGMVMGVVVYALGTVEINAFLRLIMQLTVGVLVYIVFSLLINKSVLCDCFKVVTKGKK